MEYAELHKCTYLQEAEKVRKFYNVTCYGSQIRAFVRSKTNLQIMDMLFNTILAHVSFNEQLVMEDREGGKNVSFLP